MTRILILCAFTSTILAVGGAHAQVVVIASSGFNDVAGLNSDGVANNSPFNVNNVLLNGQGIGEPGWAGPWQNSGNNVTVVNSGQFEGDGAAAFLQSSSSARRVTQVPFSGVTAVTVNFKITSFPVTGQGVNLYLRQSNNTAIGPNWQASIDGHYRVVNGIENGSTTLLDTGFLWTMGVYQEVGVRVNMLTRTWEFSVNGQTYVPPQPLGFREAPTFLDQIDYANFVASPNGSFLDKVVVSVPEPTSLVLLGAVGAVFGLPITRQRRHRASDRTV